MDLKTPSPVQVISGALFDSVEALAMRSTRRRMNHNFHSRADDNPHRFLNVLLKGAYIQPHRHANPPKSESFIVLEGAVDVIIFDEDGRVTARYALGGESPKGHVWGIDIAPGVWHTILPRTARAVCFEVKPGPWEPSSDKEFALWAPAEGDPAAAAYAQALLNSPEPNAG
ncbi:MAG TPA: WbuC family cupin fold metalloprotein [Bryobacteraceae bacterium]